MKKIILCLALIFAILGNFAIGYAQSERGLIPLDMLRAGYGKTYLNKWIYVDAHNNFAGASFAPLEPIDSVSLNVNIPQSGWTDKIAAIPETGIVAYLKGVYYVIYVDNYTENTKKVITGVRIRYRQLEEKVPNDTISDTKTPTIFIAEDEHTLFNTNSSIIANKLKTEFIKNGYQLTQNAPQSRYQLHIKATTRRSNSNQDFVYYYADVTVELFNTLTGKSEYFENFSQKGVSTSHARAEREALTDASIVIDEKIKSFILKNEE